MGGEESTNKAKERAEEMMSTEAPSDGSDAEAPARSVSEEGLVKDEDVARIVAELLRGQQIASVYIDARSGGVFFGGEERIVGDVVRRDQTKISHETHFHGPVIGPVHAGSGDISTGGISGEVVAVGVEEDSGNVIVVEPKSSAVVAEVPKQDAYERIANDASATRQQLAQIYEHSRQQAADWTRFSLGAAALGFLFVLGSILAMLLVNTTAGLVTMAASLIPEIAAGLFFQQTREANRRVDENQKKLLEAEGMHRAIELAVTIDDEDARDRLKGTIILRALGLSGTGKVLTTPPPETDG